MAPPPPTAPLFGLPLSDSCEFPFPPALQGVLSPEKHTLFPNSAVTTSSKVLGDSPRQDTSVSTGARPPLAAVHSDLDVSSASRANSLLPYTLLPPLSWIIKPLTVRVPSPPLLPCTGPSPTRAPTHTVVPASPPPSSHLAARHHPPLVRHLLDSSVPPPSFVDLPQFLSNAAFAAEGPVTPAAARRRLSAPAAAHHHRPSFFHATDALAGLFTGAHNVSKASRPDAAKDAAKDASGGRCVTQSDPSHPSSAESDFTCSSGHVDMQKANNGKQNPGGTSSTDVPTKAASPRNEVRAFKSSREATPLGPLLQQLLTPQVGSHCRVHAAPENKQSVEQWRRPTVLIPPFFSSPAALQRSENTLQSELASTVLRCRAAELRQQRLLQIAAAVIHQAVRVHASRIADIIEIQGTAAATATRTALPVAVPGVRLKRERRPGTGSKRASRLSSACNRESDKNETFSGRYYDWLCGSAELKSNSGDRGQLQCLPVVVAPAGADVADHRLAVHGLLRECVRRWHSSNIVDTTAAADDVSQRDSLFLRLAIIRPTHCSSVGSAMHAIYEQITQVPLSSSALPSVEESGAAIIGRSSPLQREAAVRNASSRTSSRNAGSNERRPTLHSESVSSVTRSVHAGSHGSYVGYDGGAAAAWGENKCVVRRSAHVSSAAADASASLSAYIDATQHDEFEVATELQQLNGRNARGAEGGASDVASLRMQEEFWEIENETAAVAALLTCDAEQSTCGAAGRSSSRHGFHQGAMKEQHYLRQVHSVDQQQFMQQQKQQQHRDYDDQQQRQLAECYNHLSFPRLSPSKLHGTGRSYARRTRESGNVCEKLACWWATQQQVLLQRSSEGYNGRGDAGAAPVRSPSRRTASRQPRGEKCASWGVRTRAAPTHLDSTASQGNFPAAPSEEDSNEEEEEGKGQQERTSEGSAEEEEKGKKREQDAVEEANTTDTESNNEVDLQNNDSQVPRGIRGKTAAAATAAFRLCHDNSRSNTMQPAAVVIVLEEAEAFPGGLLVRLLQLLALLRQQLSLPFIIVATASTNATVLQQLCDVPLSSGCCLTVEPATLLQPARVQQQLLQLLLCCPAALPFALPLAAAEKLLQSIEETSPSVLQLLRRLQLLLRVFYQHHPLAFLCRDLDGVAALMRFQNDGCVLKPAVNMQQQQQRSSSSSTAAHARATLLSGSSSERPCPRKTDGVHTTAKEEAIQEEKSSSSSPQEQQFLQQHVHNNNSRDITKPTRDFAAVGTSVASTAATNLKHDPSRELHAERVVRQLRRRVELLSFTSLTEDHVHMLRQLLRHTNEVFIHLTAAQQEGLLFFDRCCWEQVQLQRQHQRRMLLAAAAASSNGAAPPRSSDLLPPLQRDAAASTLALRCRPEEESENRELQQQQFSSSNEQGRAAAPGGCPGAGGRSPLLGTVGLVASVREDHVRRKTHSGCRRLAGCVARRSTLGLLKSWWGGRGLLLLHRVEEEEKQQQLLQQQQQEQGEQSRVLPSAATSSGLGQRQLPTGGEDTQGDLMPLKLKLLCKEVLPAASVELLQRRVGCCMGYRLLFVLQQQLQRCRRLASATATDVEAASATAGNCGEKFIGGVEAGRSAGNVELRAGENEHQQEEIDAAEEEEVLLRIAAEGEANSNCRQTIETLDLLVGAHEEFSCLLRKCKPHTRVQEMAKACFAVEQEVRRVVVSLFEQFAVAAPVRVSAAVAAAQPPEVLADPAALVLPLKLFRAQVRREVRLLRLLAAAEEAHQRREHQLTCGFDAANSMDAAAAAHAPPTGKAYEVQQQQVPWYSDLPTHSFEVVRMLDALDALICELSKAASSAVPAFPDAACVGVAPAGRAAPRRVGERTLTEAGTPEAALSDAVANTQQREEDVAQNNLYSSKKRVQAAEAAAGQHRLARSSPQGTALATSAAVAHQKRRQTEPAVGTLRALVSLKRKFLRWVEEALLLLLLPLPGWHPLGGELAVWGGALGFEVVAAAVQSAPGAAAQPPAASDCPPVLQSSAGNARSAAHKRYTAGTPSGTLAAAAELVCGSFEAAPQTETLQHAAMGSPSFLQRFNVPLEEEGKEGEEEEACVFQAQPQQRKQQRQQPLQHPSQGQEETSAESRTETGRETGEAKGAGKCIGEAGRHEEEVKLEDVAIVLRLVNSAGRRINMWDLFCAFCRDLLRDRLKKKRTEIGKKRQTGTYEGKEGRLQCSRPENISGTSCSPYPNRCGGSQQVSGSGSVTKKWLSQRQKRRHTRVSESDVEEEVLRLMEAESCSLHADSTAVCNKSKCLMKNSGPTAGPPQSRECQHAKCLTAENSRRQKAASSRITQADVPSVGCTSHIFRSPVGTRRDTPLSRIVDAAASPTADAFTAVEASLASGAVFAADDPSAVPVQLRGSAPGDRVPWTLLQQLQLRFAVAVETLDHQLGVIRLPSAASAAAAVERVMLDEDEGEDAAVHPDFSVVPPAGEQTASGDKVSPQEVDEIDVNEEDASEAEEEAEQEEFPPARDARGGTREQKQRSVESCKAGGTQKQGENTEQPERRYSRALRSTRGSRRGLAASERGRSAVSSSEEQQEDAEQIGVPLVPDDMLTHELRTMRKLLRNVFARRTHFVPISINPAEESGDDTVESSGNNVERFSDEEAEGRRVRKKSCSSRRKPHRRTRKKILL